MDLVTLPYELFVFYGGLVLSCGAAVGFIVGRNLRKPALPKPPDDLDRRLSLLEEELELARDELHELGEENRFLRELRRPAPAREVTKRENDDGRAAA